ncbi:MAG TPA: hypothetical protein DIW31_07640, partial [Bacteroidales bacterium]|nr:hypothetical protein [Bacteroidales bacterium]
MNIGDIKISKKLSLAFGVVTFVLAIVSIWSIWGIGGIVVDAKEMTNGNKLRGDLQEKYIQHLEWTEQLKKFLTDSDVKELTVQTDDHQCAFGKWYYGQGRINAEKIAPELKQFFDKFEEPHKALHNSAKKIESVFVRADRQISEELLKAKVAHLTWAQKLNTAILNHERTINIQKDPTQCDFGKWISSEDFKAFTAKNPDLNTIIHDLMLEHENLHQSAIHIENLLRNGNASAASRYFETNTIKFEESTLSKLDNLIVANNANLEGMLKADNIFQNETMVDLSKLKILFSDVINKSKEVIITDDVMVSKASTTKGAIIILSIIAFFTAILFAYIITQRIVGPL